MMINYSTAKHIIKMYRKNNHPFTKIMMRPDHMPVRAPVWNEVDPVENQSKYNMRSIRQLPEPKNIYALPDPNQATI